MQNYCEFIEIYRVTQHNGKILMVEETYAVFVMTTIAFDIQTV